MPRGPVPLKVTEPKVRPKEMLDEFWQFPHNLAAYANRLGYFRDDVATMAHVKRSTVTRWLNYELEPTLRCLVLLENAMGLPRCTLIRPIVDLAPIESANGTADRGAITVEVEQAAEREMHAGLRTRVVRRANKHSQ